MPVIMPVQKSAELKKRLKFSTKELDHYAIRFQLNAENIFDKHYFASTSGLRFMPGTPRSFLGSVSIAY